MFIFYIHTMQQVSFQAEEKVFDRIIQAFELYKNNFVNFTVTIFLYNLVALVFWLTMGKFTNSFLWGNESSGLSMLWAPSDIYITMSLWAIAFLTYIIFYIPVLVGTLKTIHDAMHEKNIDTVSNFQYGLRQFSNVMKVYWYVFEYVFLVPALILIIWLLLMLGAMMSGVWALAGLWGLVIFISVLTGIIFGVYRGLRSTFRLYGALEEEDFSKEAFTRGLEETSGKLWRIIGNFIVLSLTLWLISIPVNIAINTVTGIHPSEDIMQIKNMVDNKDQMTLENVQSTIADMTKLSLWDILHKTLAMIYKTLVSVFGLVFIYIFYLRLKEEYMSNNS